MMRFKGSIFFAEQLIKRSYIGQTFVGFCRSFTQFRVPRVQRVAYLLPCGPRPLHSGPRIGLVTPVYLQAYSFPDRIALVNEHGVYKYGDLLLYVNHLTDRIADTLSAQLDDTSNERIAILCPNDASYVVAQTSVLMSGGVAVPLMEKHPPWQLEYFISDSQCRLVIATEELAEKVKPIVSKLGIQLLTLRKSDYCIRESDVEGTEAEFDDTAAEDELLKKQERWGNRLNRLMQLRNANKFKYRPACIFYTSGTTGSPKGVVHTYGSLQAQIVGMINRWQWTPNDVLLHVLPLHHVHGNINALMTPMSCGACCVMMPSFEPSQVWSKLLSPVTNTLPSRINMFMAVPTVYAKLIENYDNRLNRGRGTKRAKDYLKTICSTKIRLFVSGSAALPAPIMQRWEEITGHTLLERYGMTELGMALTNPLNGTRTPGAVGHPFPFVEVCVARANVYAPNGYDILAQGNSRRTKVTGGCENESGELYVRGPNMFEQYWNKPEATKEAFTADGWFKTGDTAVFESKVGAYRILGRTSVDIIKSGGYKISALDIERHLLEHPCISEAAVVGVTDITWGQKVAAVVVLRPSSDPITLDGLRRWCSDRLPPYQLPTVLRVVDSISRNAMGKINKKELVAELFGKENSTATR